jgi:hypothetical protein
MSIQSDIVTALAAVAGGRVYPQAAPQDAALPFVVYRRTAYEPVNLLQGAATNARSTFTFECWGTTLDSALTTAAAVVAAVEAAAPLASRFRVDGSGDDYEPVADVFMEPISYSFWHAV